ncbi:MAG: ABC transporter ATP-binding protein [Saprospiraceae bacterium]|nr:ABC transporter ATP-binding protein [Saprospiraceae bacterium]
MLKIEQLEVAYGQQTILNGLDLTFHEGEIHGVLGMNGAGKTTFFKTIYGHLSALSGQCLYKNNVVSSQSIAFLETQNYFYPYMKGKEYLELMTTRNKAFQVDRWNEVFELPLDRFIDNYSTGMKKKLAFMGILALDRPILILDEPFNGVDVESNEKIAFLLKKLKASGKIIIISSHIIHSLTSICDKISHLDKGKIARTYTPNEFPDLEEQLRAWVQAGIGDVLNELIP